MGLVRASKTSVPVYQTIRHISEEYSSTSLPEAQQSVAILRWTRSPDVVIRRWVPSLRLSAALRINCPHSINKWPSDASESTPWHMYQRQKGQERACDPTDRQTDKQTDTYVARPERQNLSRIKGVW